MIHIAIRHQLHTAREKTTALAVEITLEKGEFVAVMGRSGAGKTTLLRILAGLVTPDTGIIEVNGNCWLDMEKKKILPVQKRKIGFVFQDFALFPNMTVRENLLYALSNPRDTALVDRLLGMVDMTSLAHRKPDTLSGGQQQRVAMIRALASRPEILLLDEALSALDGEMRSRLREELATLHREFRLTTLMVTHDLADVYRLADRVVEIDGGSVIQNGPPETVFRDARLSSKVRLQGEVLRVVKSGVVYIVEIATGNTIIKVIAAEEEAARLTAGSKVLVFSKAFNPVIQPL